MEECSRPLDFIDPITFKGGPVSNAQRKKEMKKRGIHLKL